MHKSLYVIIPVVIFSILVVAIVTSSDESSATGGSCGDDLYWSVEDKTLTITGTGSMYDYPNGGPWGITGIDYVFVGKDVTHVYAPAFSRIQAKEYTVDPGNAYYRSLDGVLYDKAMTVLYSYPICKADEQYTVPEGIVAIDDYAIAVTKNLKSISIPSTVKEIYPNDLRSSTLENIEVSTDNLYFSSKQGILYSADYRILYKCPAGKVFPSGCFYADNNTKEIGKYSFLFSQVETVYLYNVISIRENAFEFCTKLKNVLAIDNVETIEPMAFQGCTSLKSFNIPTKMTMVDGTVFENSGLLSITIPNNITIIGGAAFYGCRQMKSVTIGEGVQSIGSKAFFDCISLTNINIGSNLSNMSTDSFGDTYFYESNGTTLLDRTAAELSGRSFTGTVEKMVSSPSYTVSYSLNGGTGTVPVTKRYQDGVSIVIPDIDATKVGYDPVSWSDGKNSYLPGSIYKISSSNVNFVLNWKVKTFVIEVSCNDGGTTSGSGVYDYGSIVTITAVADSDYHFTKWNDGNTASSRKITVTENATFEAVFEHDSPVDPPIDSSVDPLIYGIGAAVLVVAAILSFLVYRRMKGN